MHSCNWSHLITIILFLTSFFCVILILTGCESCWHMCGRSCPPVQMFADQSDHCTHLRSIEYTVCLHCYQSKTYLYNLLRSYYLLILQGSTPSPLPVLSSHISTDDNSVTVAHTSVIRPTFETIVSSSHSNQYMCMTLCDFKC